MKSISFIFLLFISISVFSQNSFSKELFFQDDYFITGFASTPRIDMNGVLSTVLDILPNNQFGIVFLSQTGTPISFKKMESGNTNHILSNTFYYNKKDSWHMVNIRSAWMNEPGNTLFLGNFENNTFRSYFFPKRITYNYPAITNSLKVIYPHKIPQTGTSSTFFGYSLIDINSGMVEWSKYFSNSNPNWISHRPTSMASLPNSEIICLTESFYEDEEIISKIGLKKISENGHFIKGIEFLYGDKSIRTIQFSEIGIDEIGNIYIPLKIQTGLDTNIEDFEAVIIKTDSNLNIIWSKKLHAENFHAYSFNIKTYPNGNTLFSYATEGDLPIIVGKISSGGELLWHRGYGFYDPRMDIGIDSSIVFYTYLKYLDNGETAISNILVKTTPDGEIEGCPQFDACIELIDIDIQTEEVHWISEPAPMPIPVEITVSDGTFTTQDYCGTPPPPTADFILPDTICQYECLVPDSTNNRYAHHVEWHITGENTDTIIADTTFTWCFEEAGTYFVEQEIWLLGCSEVYMHRLTVLSDGLTSPLGEDRTICDELPVELIPASSRPLKSFLWDDGSQTESRLLTASGTYYLTATDGYCSIEDTVTLNVLQETIHPPFLDIPNDTLLCPDLLPLTLYPTSIYTDTFFLNDGTLPSNEINIYEAGDHSIWASIQGCLFEENIHVEIEPCKVPVFLPNAFSPNDDGINDFLYLLGEDFDPVKIQVFDRWGGLIYASDIPPIRWDGNAAGKELDAGVYLVSFTYFNKRNRREELLSKDVLLVR